MGSTQSTNLDIDPLFEGELPPPAATAQSVCIRVTLPKPSWSAESQCRFDRLDILIRPGDHCKLKFYQPEDQLWVPSRRYQVVEWQPASHMRDFEVLDPFSEQQIRIARGQGIGVLVVEPLCRYAKLWYDPQEPGGVNWYHCCWAHTAQYKNVYAADLGLGYDSIFIDQGGVVHRLCEERDSRDTKDTYIAIPSCSGLDSYNPDPTEPPPKRPRPSLGQEDDTAPTPDSPSSCPGDQSGYESTE